MAFAGWPTTENASRARYAWVGAAIQLLEFVTVNEEDEFGALVGKGPVQLDVMPSVSVSPT
jgi:hypothetical protein